MVEVRGGTSLPVEALRLVHGKNNEHLRPDKERIEELAISIKERGFLLGKEPLVIVTSRGIPLVYEGNNRIRAARRAGLTRYRSSYGTWAAPSSCRRYGTLLSGALRE